MMINEDSYLFAADCVDTLGCVYRAMYYRGEPIVSDNVYDTLERRAIMLFDKYDNPKVRQSRFDKKVGR